MKDLYMYGPQPGTTQEVLDLTNSEFGITTTPIEIFKAGSWEEFCKDFDIDLWVVNEGELSQDQKLRIPLEKAEKYGIIKLESDKTESRMIKYWPDD